MREWCLAASPGGHHRQEPRHGKEPQYVTVEHCAAVVDELCRKITDGFATMADDDTEFRKAVAPFCHAIAAREARSGNEITLRLEQPPMRRVIERAEDGNISGFYDVDLGHAS